MDAAPAHDDFVGDRLALGADPALSGRRLRPGARRGDDDTDPRDVLVSDLLQQHATQHQELPSSSWLKR